MMRRLWHWLTATYPVELVHHPDTIRFKSFSLNNELDTEWIKLKDYLAPRCPSLFGPEAKFHSTWWLSNGHLQTIWAAYSKFEDEYLIHYERELLDLPDGGKIALDWTPAPPNEETKHIPTLIIASGLTGGSHEAYIRSLLELITLPREENAEPVCRAVVVNFRGCAGSQLYTPRLYSGAWTDDFRFAVSHVKHRCPTAKLGGLGFSLGSNVLVKYLGEEGEHCPLSFAMSVSNPFDMLVGSLALDRSWLGRYIYSPAMANNLKAIYLKHYDQLKLDPRIDPEQALSAKNIREFDQRVTSKAFNYDTADDYYRDASSSRWITRVRVPLLCLNAKDDPITSIEGAPIDEIRFNPFVILALTSCGGHIGWFEGWFSPRRWCCKPLAEFTEAMFKLDAQYDMEQVPEPSQPERMLPLRRGVPQGPVGLTASTVFSN